MPYSSYIKRGALEIASISPELFFKKTGTHIRTKPMKGTWPREGFSPDRFLGGLKLKYDPKNRAENVMIADLLRNDLGKLGSSVRAVKLFEVGRYKTLFQMTSTIDADVKPDVPLYNIFQILFPSGSVTGAPKIKAMEIIRLLEREERKIYTGAIGCITPDRNMCFSVPIRTMILDGENSEMGVGGGIIWDSTAEGEWRECAVKTGFLGKGVFK